LTEWDKVLCWAI